MPWIIRHGFGYDTSRLRVCLVIKGFVACCDKEWLVGAGRVWWLGLCNVVLVALTGMGMFQSSAG